MTYLGTCFLVRNYLRSSKLVSLLLPNVRCVYRPPNSAYPVVLRIILQKVIYYACMVRARRLIEDPTAALDRSFRKQSRFAIQKYHRQLFAVDEASCSSFSSSSFSSSFSESSSPSVVFVGSFIVQCRSEKGIKSRCLSAYNMASRKFGKAPGKKSRRFTYSCLPCSKIFRSVNRQCFLFSSSIHLANVAQSEDNTPHHCEQCKITFIKR